jgi:hypothetical protein
LANRTPAAETEVISAETRLVGLDQATADWVLFLDHEDDPDDELLDALLSAQAASQADAVTTGTRSGEGDGLQLFLGDPGALGLVLNQYGVLGLVRRSSAAAHLTSEAALDPDWPLFARLARAGGRIVSIPVPLATHSGRPGMVGDVPGDGLVVLEAFEGPAAAPVEDLPQLTATLGAAVQRLEARQPVTSVVHGGLIRRAIRVIRSDGVVGLARRAQARVGRNDG